MKFKFILTLITLSLLTACSFSNDPLPIELLQDRSARTEIKAEKYEDALQMYLEMVEQNPNRYSTHSNIGVLLGMIQKPEDAEKSLLHALKLAEETKEPQALFTTRFNLGVLYGSQKKVPQALENYQQALEVLPTSIETKTNIELLIQQQQNQQGEGESNSQDTNQQNQEGQNQQQKNDQQGKQDEKKEDEAKPKEDQERQSSPRYKPRPFAGDQLSEGDVKKILGELRNQEQKIRANFDKKEKGQSSDNEKDW
jgi:Ca-activated chloride channel family protein